MSKRDKQIKLRISTAYAQGVQAFKSGMIDSNPYGLGMMLERSCWSAGFFDSYRGMV